MNDLNIYNYFTSSLFFINKMFTFCFFLFLINKTKKKLCVFLFQFIIKYMMAKGFFSFLFYFSLTFRQINKYINVCDVLVISIPMRNVIIEIFILFLYRTFCNNNTIHSLHYYIKKLQCFILMECHIWCLSILKNRIIL